MSGEDIFWLEIHELSERIGEGELSPVDVVEALLGRIDSLNPDILGFLEVTGDAALAEAKQAQEEIAAGRRLGPLHGVPFGVKDIIDTAGVRTTRGSSFFRDRIPDADAECVARLKRAGAILLGKCHTQEFASGPLSQNAHFGTAHNPWDLDAHDGRLQHGFRRLGRGRPLPGRHRDGHGQLDSRARGAVRARGAQAHPRAGQPARRVPQLPEL